MAALIPNRRVGDPLAPPFAFAQVDILFSYRKWLEDSKGVISPGVPAPAKVGIIGAGVSGLCAAYELSKVSNVSVVLFEGAYDDLEGDASRVPTVRTGGRTYSRRFVAGQPEIAEMGAMRFPPSSESLFYYLQKFGIQYTPNFPDPGVVLTDIRYRNKTYPWLEGKIPLPPIFEDVNNGWNAFVANGKPAMGLDSPDSIFNALKKLPVDPSVRPGIVASWTKYIDTFKDLSFFAGLKLLFNDADAPGGKPWSYPQDYEIFGALGLGSGGFGPLYNIGFLDIVRLLMNGLEQNQQFVLSGIGSLADAFLNAKVDHPGGRTGKLADEVVFGTAGAIGRQSDNTFNVSYFDANGQAKVYRGLSRVIVATTTRSMQIHLNVVQGGLPSLMQENYVEAINRMHMIDSSKLFLKTPTKFWRLDPTLPQSLQTDSLVRGVYCLDYTPSTAEGPGVVLVSYVWEDDSSKLEAIKDKEARFQILKNDIRKTNAAFADQLVPAGSLSENLLEIDWQQERLYYGAFKLNRPGQEYLGGNLFFQFQSSQGDFGIYLAGDGVSFSGGWVEGGLVTGLNAAAAVVHSLKGTFSSAAYNPIVSIDAGTYNYYVSGPADDASE